MFDPLRDVPLSAQIGSEEIADLTDRCGGQELLLAAGELVKERELGKSLLVLLEGRLRAVRRSGGLGEVLVVSPANGREAPVVIATHLVSSLEGLDPSRLLKVDSDQYLQAIASHSPSEGIIVAGLLRRTQNAESVMRQREKLAALGKIAAGLAHELNNPASAIQRAAGHMGDALEMEAGSAAQLVAATIGEERSQAISSLAHLPPVSSGLAALDPLERADEEEQLASWLESVGVPDSWRLAPTLLAAGLGREPLEALRPTVGAGTWATAVPWVAARLAAASLLGQIQESSARISELVSAVKEYTQMDRGPLQEVDVHRGLDSTLAMLGHKLKGIRVVRDYAPGVPLVAANGGELNQVWTNLIDNAADALNGSGQITLRTALRDGRLLVEVGGRRTGHTTGGPAADLRALLHHQGLHPGGRVGAGYQLSNRGGQARRGPGLPVPTGRNPFPGLPAPGRRPSGKWSRLATRASL